MVTSERPPDISLAASHNHADEGGYAVMAAELNFHGWPCEHVIVRQNVWQWWHRRARTGFPAGRLVPGKTKQHRVFETAAVISWWDGYRGQVRWRATVTHTDCAPC